MSQTILIVEDEADVRTYLSTVLQANGYQAVEAADAESGLKTAERERPDLISLDIMMPRKSGLSLYVDLRRHPELGKTPIVIVTGMAQHGEFDILAHLEGKEVPEPERVVEKPVSAEAYVDLVKSLIGPPEESEDG